MDDPTNAAAEPDLLALVDVLDLIAPGALVHGWEALPGGLMADLHRIDVRMPSGAETAFVLRVNRAGTDEDGPFTLAMAATLEALRETLVPAPEVLWVDPDGAVFGTPAMAMTLLPGTPDLGAAAAGAWVRAIAEALVGVQWVPATAVAHLPRLADPAALRDWLAHDRDPGTELVDVAAMAAALDRRVAPVAPTLCHGDYHPGNLLRDGTRVTGIVDWAHPFVGDPRFDVAYCTLDLALAAGREVADAFVAEYEALRGEIADRWWFELLAAWTALPDPAPWQQAHVALGADVDTATCRARFAAFVADALERADA